MRREMAAGLIAGLMTSGALWAQEAPAEGQAAAPAEAPAAAAPADAGTVMATVEGTEITLGHVAALRERLPEQYQELPDPALLRIVLEQLIDQTLLARTVSADPASDPLAVRLQLDNTRREALATRALNARMGEVVGEAEIQAEYDARFKSTAGQTEYNAAHILVATEAEAADLKTRIDGGGDFAALARERSTDKVSGAQGGDLGWFAPGRMVPEFEAAVASTPPGSLAGPVRTQFGWHLILVKETRPATPPPLEAVRGQIAEQLGREAVQEVLASLREGADIEINATEIDPAAIRDPAVLAE